MRFLHLFQVKNLSSIFEWLSRLFGIIVQIFAQLQPKQFKFEYSKVSHEKLNQKPFKGALERFSSGEKTKRVRE